MGQPGAFAHHFGPLFPFQLGGSSAPEIIGAWPKEAGNLVDLPHSANGLKVALCLMPHVLMVTVEDGKYERWSGAAICVGRKIPQSEREAGLSIFVFYPKIPFFWNRRRILR